MMITTDEWGRFVLCQLSGWGLFLLYVWFVYELCMWITKVDVDG